MPGDWSFEGQLIVNGNDLGQEDTLTRMGSFNGA